MTLSSSFRRTAVGGVIGVLAACSGDTTSPPKPALLAATQAVTIDGTAGLPVPASPTFVVKDDNGNILGGVSVTVTVTAGGGTIPDAPTKTIAGSPTPIGTWTLGKVAGVNTVTITAAGLSPITISVNGKPGPPASIVFISGANQSGLAGTSLPVAPVAQVRDQFGNGVPGIPVLFTIADGDGTVIGLPITTDAAGNASASSYKLGKSVVPQSLRASAAGFSALLTAIVISDYAIDLRFYGPPMPDEASDAFTAAAARIRGSVVGDISDVNVGAPVDLEKECGITGVTLPAGIIDDLIIYAAVAPIDGPGKVLASAFPCLIRNTPAPPAVPTPNSGLTVIGVMQFDTDDIQTLINSGRLKDVVQHEMLHVVGIGTLWKIKGLLAGAKTVDSRFTGALGVAACIALGGATVCPGSVPVENSGGAGTADGHWREVTFGNELMTGFINAGVNPFSIISIQSMGDLGYTVNSGAADPYSIPGLSLQASRSSILAELAPAWEQVYKPRMLITRAGQITPVQQQ